MAGAPELGAHPGEQRAGLERPLGGGGRGPVLLPPRRDVAVDPPPAERAKIGGRAVAGIGRDLLRIALEMGLDGVEQRRELRLIAAVIVEGVRHDDLRRRIDRSLRVVALDVAVLGLQDAAVRIGEIALRLAVGLALRRRWRPAAPFAAFGDALLLGLLAARIFSSRFSLSATHSGISSPRLSPKSLSSSASAASAALSQRSTSASSSASRFFRRS